MGAIRCSVSALRSLAHMDKCRGTERGRRTFAHVSPTMLRVGQTNIPRQASSESAPWMLPAALALLGLSFSTFCTHQLVSTSGGSRTAKFAKDSSSSAAAIDPPADSEQ